MIHVIKTDSIDEINNNISLIVSTQRSIRSCVPFIQYATTPFKSGQILFYSFKDLVVEYRQGGNTKRTVYKQWQILQADGRQGNHTADLQADEAGLFNGIIGALTDSCTCI